MNPSQDISLGIMASHEVLGRQSKHKIYSRQQWEDLKPMIHELYLVKNLQFKQIAAYLRHHHEFEPTYVLIASCSYRN
jgi:hypothetical protein